MLIRKVHATVKLKNLVNFNYAIFLTYILFILHAVFSNFNLENLIFNYFKLMNSNSSTSHSDRKQDKDIADSLKLMPERAIQMQLNIHLNFTGFTKESEK